jgi:hypothetical protein
VREHAPVPADPHAVDETATAAPEEIEEGEDDSHAGAACERDRGVEVGEDEGVQTRGPAGIVEDDAGAASQKRNQRTIDAPALASDVSVASTSGGTPRVARPPRGCHAFAPTSQP